MSFRQRKLPVSIYRGGTSRALFFHEKDIPSSGTVRDQVLLRAMGSPHNAQIDGLGGAVSPTSKVAIIKKSTTPGVDIDYTFAQVGISESSVDYSANCGNISSAVGPFAIDEGLVEKFRPGKSIQNHLKTQLVTIYNTGTKKYIYSHVPITEEGLFHFEGSFKVDGVPGTGAPILIDWKETIGASRNKGILPTGNAIDSINVSGQNIDATICDVGNIAVFAKAADFGISGSETSLEIDSNIELDIKLREFRSKAAELVGMTNNWKSLIKETPFTPFIVLLSKSDSGFDIQARLILKNHCHPSLAGSGAICIAACSRVSGSVLNKMLPIKALSKSIITIEHLKGNIPVWVELKNPNLHSKTTPTNISFDVLAIGRTARKILDGYVYVPESTFE